jgi:cyclophilin family peptidyl-prolyl cis-trans isomerase
LKAPPIFMKKSFIAAIFLLAAGIAGANNSFLTNFPQGFYITPTAGATLTTPLNQYFHVDSITNTNLVWVSTDTQYGGFLMELLPTNAPKTVANFLSYVKDGAYENTIIHRSTSLTNDGLAVLQAGGFTADGSLSSIPTFAPITNEYSLSNALGTVAMAKLGGNPNSATSQWFVNVSDNSSTLNSSNNGGFTVFAKILGSAMSSVIAPISALHTYNLSGYNSAFTETPLQGVTNGQQSLYLSNLVTFTRVATLPYFAYSSDSDACPADINSSTNLIVTFKHYPTNNPINGVYITVAVTDTNGFSPTYTNYTSSNGSITTTKSSSVVSTNIYNAANTGFYVIPTTLGNQTITFPQIPQQAISNNIVNLTTNITTNYIGNGSNITIGSITTNVVTNSIFTTFYISPFPYSSANVPVFVQILSGTNIMQVSTNTNQTSSILNGTEFILKGAGTVTLKATTYTGGLVGYYYNPANPVTNTLVIKAFPQSISSFQTIIPPTYGTPPFQIQIPTSSSQLPVTVRVLSGPATFNQASNTGTITITGAGPVTLAANQSGSALYAPAPQVTTSFTVAQAFQSITFPRGATNLAVGQTATLSATSSAALPVSFTLVGGPATLTGSSLKITGPGTVSVSANQIGNSNYLAATPVTNSYTTASNQTISAFGAITNRPYTTNPITIILPTATSKLPVSLSVKSGPASQLSSNSITLTGTGTITLAADQSGNSNYFPAPQVTTSFVVSKAAQSIPAFTGIPPKLTNGIAPFTVTIPSASSGLTNTSLLVTGSGKLSSSNIITLTNAGTLTITATNAGNSNYLAASLTTNITVAAGSQTISFPAFSSPLVVGSTNSLTATASSGLPVGYSLTPSSTNVLLVSNSIVVRSYTTNTFKVIASQTGNTGWNPALTKTNNFTVTTNTPSSSTGGTLTLGGGYSGVTIVNGGSGSLTTGGSSNSYSGGSTISNGALNLNSNSGNLTLSNSSSSNASSSNTISLGTGTLSISNTNNSGSTTSTNSVGGSISLATNVVIITSPTPTPTP